MSEAFVQVDNRWVSVSELQKLTTHVSHDPDTLSTMVNNNVAQGQPAKPKLSPAQRLLEQQRKRRAAQLSLATIEVARRQNRGK